MNVRSLKLAGAAAGVLFLLGAAPQAFAQLQLFSNYDPYGNDFFPYKMTSVATPSTTSYTFNSSMILNSIGFCIAADDPTPTSFAYSINGTNQSFNSSNLIRRDRFAWLDLSSPLTMQKNDVIRISTLGFYQSGPNLYYTRVTDYGTFNTNANVSIVDGELGSDINGNTFLGHTNGNLIVSPSNPGSNVAPEPGSIALLLTGGGALAGIALRRRRNAA
jgi:hypothetical protein